MNKIDELIKKLYRDEEVAKFIDENNLSHEDVINFYGPLSMQVNNNVICNKCLGKIPCQMHEIGMKSYLEFYNNRVQIVNKPCPYYEKHQRTNLEMLYFPEEMSGEQELITNPERAEFTKEMIRFQKEYKKGSFVKGIYVHGPFGNGKTFMILKLAKAMAKKYRVVFVYYPDLVRKLKSSFGDSDFEYTINTLKKADILFFDDVGAENTTPFIRDEVLGTVLQYRMFSNLPTFMTSNLSLEMLRKHLQETSSDVNHMAGDRLIERIRYMMNEIELIDKNYRL